MLLKRELRILLIIDLKKYFYKEYYTVMDKINIVKIGSKLYSNKL